MSNKLLLKYLSVIVLVGIVVFSGYRIYKNSKPEEQYIFNEKDKTKEPESEIEETKDEYIIVTKVSYSGQYRTTKRIYSTGKMDQSTVLDETTASNENKEKFVNIGSITDEDLKVVKETIEDMSKEKFKQSDFSESYGISVKLKAKDKIFYSAEYFTQDNVNKLNYIIDKY